MKYLDLEMVSLLLKAIIHLITIFRGEFNLILNCTLEVGLSSYSAQEDALRGFSSRYIYITKEKLVHYSHPLQPGHNDSW